MGKAPLLDAAAPTGVNSSGVNRSELLRTSGLWAEGPENSICSDVDMMQTRETDKRA